MEAVAERHGVTVDITTMTNAPASPATPPDSEVVLRLSAGIREIYGIEPHCDGSGGGPWPWASATWASPLRSGPASCRPIISPTNTPSFPGTIGDAQVLARMLFD